MEVLYLYNVTPKDNTSSITVSTNMIHCYHQSKRKQFNSSDTTLERAQNGWLCVGKIPSQLMYKISDGAGNWYLQSTHNFDQWDAMPPEEWHSTVGSITSGCNTVHQAHPLKVQRYLDSGHPIALLMETTWGLRRMTNQKASPWKKRRLYPDNTVRKLKDCTQLQYLQLWSWVNKHSQEVVWIWTNRDNSSYELYQPDIWHRTSKFSFNNLLRSQTCAGKLR